MVSSLTLGLTLEGNSYDFFELGTTLEPQALPAGVASAAAFLRSAAFPALSFAAYMALLMLRERPGTVEIVSAWRPVMAERSVLPIA